MKLKKFPFLYALFLIVVLSFWFVFMFQNNLFYLFKEKVAVFSTMIFGSFIAGSSPEGSASIAYPIFTLYLNIEPKIASNFAFAIQSIGMTAASLLILNMKMKIDWQYVKYVIIGGLPGLAFGTYQIVPLISPPLAKLFFVSLWLSFGIILWRHNQMKHKIKFEFLQQLKSSDIGLLIIFGFIGGIISSIFGTGINIFTFCLMITYYKIDEKIATPSSILIMTIETIFGLFLHTNLVNDFKKESFEMWLVCVPVVVFFAPLGSFVMNKMSSHLIAKFLSIILFIQFFGAIIVIRPSFILSVISVAVILFGFLIFNYITQLGDIRFYGKKSNP